MLHSCRLREYEQDGCYRAIQAAMEDMLEYRSVVGGVTWPDSLASVDGSPFVLCHAAAGYALYNDLGCYVIAQMNNRTFAKI